MNLLFITPRVPYPPLKGDQVVSFHRIRTLSRNHDITLLTFQAEESETDGIRQLEQYCSEVHTVRLPAWRSLLNILSKAPRSPLPLQVLYYHSGRLRRKLDTLLKENAYDLVHAFMLRMSPYLSHVSHPKVMELIDSMQLNLKRRLELENGLSGLIYREEYRRVKPYEAGIGKHFDRLILVSEIDKQYIRADNVSVVQLGVDTSLFKPAEGCRKPPSIVFSGNMGYSPNIRAITWFVRNCYPSIQEKIPRVELIIAGGNPSAEIRSLERERGITVTGFTASLSEVIRRAAVAIAPMRSGSGMQFKILEAMACGLPVVTTTLGLGDIKARGGEEILVADAPPAFSEAVVTMITDRARAHSMGTKARQYIQENHSWESAAGAIESVYGKVLERG
jgi:sugar transferase (PEP-CTERM/EpsH1 system associated)